MVEHMSPRRRFMAALWGGCTDRPAVGTVTSLANTEAMDMCGAVFPEAHWDSKKMSRLAAYVSLETGFDMIFPVFSVVHEAAGLGAEIDWGQKDVMPTVRNPLWREPEEIRVPDNFENQPGMAVILEALRMLKIKYGEKYAIVGKAFGPWSLAYHMFGIENVLIMTIENPEKLKRILSRLTEVTIRSAMAQIMAGADVLCLADHCSHDLCSRETYKEFLFPLHKDIARRVRCPLVLHTCGDTSDRIHLFADTGLSCFHYDTSVPAAKAVELASGKMSLTGGVSNVASLLRGDEERIKSDVRAALSAGVNIIGPECAVPLNTKMRSLRLIRELALSSGMEFQKEIPTTENRARVIVK